MGIGRIGVRGRIRVCVQVDIRVGACNYIGIGIGISA